MELDLTVVGPLVQPHLPQSVFVHQAASSLSLPSDDTSRCRRCESLPFASIRLGRDLHPQTPGLLADSLPPGIDIGRPSRVFPVTPPCVRVRTRRFKLVMSWVSIGDSVSPGPRRPRQAVPSTGLGCDSAAMDRVPYEPCRLPEGATLLETPVAGIGFGARPTASRPCTEGVCEPSRPGREAPTDSGRTRSRPASPAGIVPADKLQPPGSYHTSDRSSSARAA